MLELLATLDSSARIQRAVVEKRLVLWEWMVKSSAADFAEANMVGLENLSVEPVRATFDFVQEEVVAAAVVVAAAESVAVAGDGGLVPCRVEPILGWHLEDCPRPFQQKPWESCMGECLHSVMFSAFPARFFVALVSRILVESSLLLASSCLPRLWRATSFSWILLPLAIAVGELVAVPWADLKAVVRVEVVAEKVEVMS